MSETDIHTFAPMEEAHPNILSIARLLARQAATAKYLLPPSAINRMQGMKTNDNECTDEAGSDLRAIQ